MGHSAWNYGGSEVWYVVGGPCQSPPFPFPLSPLSQYAGMCPECSGISVELRNYLDGSTGRYRSAFPCTESSGGALTCRTRTSVCRRWSRLRDVYLTVSSSLTGSLAMCMPFNARVTFQLLCSRCVSVLQSCYCYPVWSGRC